MLLGPFAGWLLSAGAKVSILGTNGDSILHGPRYLYALAQDGYGPRFLGSVHERFRTAAAAVLLQLVITPPLALSGTFKTLTRRSRNQKGCVSAARESVRSASRAWSVEPEPLSEAKG